MVLKSPPVEQSPLDGWIGAARLAGVEVPKHDDTEKTFADLKARIANTVAFVESIQPNDIDGEGRAP